MGQGRQGAQRRGDAQRAGAPPVPVVPAVRRERQLEARARGYVFHLPRGDVRFDAGGQSPGSVPNERQGTDRGPARARQARGGCQDATRAGRLPELDRSPALSIPATGDSRPGQFAD